MNPPSTDRPPSALMLLLRHAWHRDISEDVALGIENGDWPVDPQETYRGVGLAGILIGQWKGQGERSDIELEHLVLALAQRGVRFDLLYPADGWQNATLKDGLLRSKNLLRAMYLDGPDSRPATLATGALERLFKGGTRAILGIGRGQRNFWDTHVDGVSLGCWVVLRAFEPSGWALVPQQLVGAETQADDVANDRAGDLREIQSNWARAQYHDPIARGLCRLAQNHREIRQEHGAPVDTLGEELLDHPWPSWAAKAVGGLISRVAGSCGGTQAWQHYVRARLMEDQPDRALEWMELKNIQTWGAPDASFWDWIEPIETAVTLLTVMRLAAAQSGLPAIAGSGLEEMTHGLCQWLERVGKILPEDWNERFSQRNQLLMNRVGDSVGHSLLERIVLSARTAPSVDTAAARPRL